MVAAAIRGSRATTVEGLGSDIDFARLLETQNLPDIQNQMRDLVNSLINNTHRVLDLFRNDLPQMAVALQSVFTNFSNNLHQAYNSLMGIKENPAVVWERNKEAYNNQLKLMKVQLALLYAEIQARLAATSAHLRYLGIVFGGGGGPGTGEGERPGGSGAGTKRFERRDIAGAGGGGHKGGQMPASDEPPLGGDPAALYNWILNFIQGIMRGLPGLITGGMPAGAGGGGGGGARRQRESDQADIRRDVSLFGASDIRRQIADTNQWLVEFKLRIKEAGFGAAEAARLIAEGTAEAGRRLAEIRQGVVDRFQAFMGIGQGPLAQLGKQFNSLVQEIKDAGFGADRTAFMVARLTAEYQHQLDVLIATGREQAMAPHQGALDAVAGIGPFQRQLIDLNTGFEASRTALAKLAQEAIDAGRSADWLAGDLSRLDAAQRNATQKLGREFIGALGALGAAVPTEVVLELARAQWVLAKAEAIASAMALAAAGAFEGLSFTLGDIIGWITGANFDASTFAPAATRIQESMQSASDSAAEIRDTLAEAVNRLKGWTDNLLLDQSLTVLSPAQQNAEATRQLMEAFGAARSDKTGESIDNFMDVADNVLRTFRENEASGPLYQQIFAQVLRMSRSLQGISGMEFGGLSVRSQMALIQVDSLNLAKEHRREQSLEITDLSTTMMRVHDRLGDVERAILERDRQVMLSNAVGE
jgi:hypothetical protein